MKWYFLFEYRHIGIPLLITLITEVFIAFLIIRKHWALLATVLITNLVTNPLMNTLLVTTNFSNNVKFLYLFELLVIIIEGTIYYGVTKNIYKSFMISIIANVCSYIVGMLLMPFIF
jgi:hypothetical protein